MRVLVLADTLGTGFVRLQRAAAALAGRGHAVFWRGSEPPPAASDSAGGIERVDGISEVAAARADVVIGGGPGLGALAVGAWLSGAGAIVIGVAGPRKHWSLVDRWLLGSVRAATLHDRATETPATQASDDAVIETHRWPPGEAAPSPDPAHADAEHLEGVCEQLRSRRHGTAARPAAFLDRDGTLVVEKEYLAHAADIELLPGVPAALRALHSAGFALVVVSNQSGVGRGLFPRARVIEAMARLRRDLRRHGVELDAIYFCPHRPDEGCDCRKPNPGLLKRATAAHRLEPRLSAMLGDKLLDAATGQRAGGLGILVRTGYGDDEARRAEAAEYGRPPDWIATDLVAAADWLIARDGASVDPAKAKSTARSGRGWSLTPLG